MIDFSGILSLQSSLEAVLSILFLPPLTVLDTFLTVPSGLILRCSSSPTRRSFCQRREDALISGVRRNGKNALQKAESKKGRGSIAIPQHFGSVNQPLFTPFDYHQCAGGDLQMLIHHLSMIMSETAKRMIGYSLGLGNRQASSTDT